MNRLLSILLTLCLVLSCTAWGTVADFGSSSFAAKGVATPHGIALQADSAAARAALGEVQSGATVYRQGSFGVQNTADAQFWSLQNPAGTQGFANKMGMPGGSGSPDWIMGGTVSRGSPVITREWGQVTHFNIFFSFANSLVCLMFLPQAATRRLTDP